MNVFELIILITLIRLEHSHRHRYRMDDEEPDMCNTTYDAVTMFRDEMYIFKSRVSNFDLCLLNFFVCALCILFIHLINTTIDFVKCPI